MQDVPLIKRLTDNLSMKEYMALTGALCFTRDEIVAGRADATKMGTKTQEWILELYKDLGL